MSSSRNDCRIYVGNLPPDIRTKDVEDLFYRFGKVVFVDLKNRRGETSKSTASDLRSSSSCPTGPPFAFVEFEDHRDASDAVKARNNFDYDGFVLIFRPPRPSGVLIDFFLPPKQLQVEGGIPSRWRAGKFVQGQRTDE